MRSGTLSESTGKLRRICQTLALACLVLAGSPALSAEFTIDYVEAIAGLGPPTPWWERPESLDLAAEAAAESPRIAEVMANLADGRGGEPAARRILEPLLDGPEPEGTAAHMEIAAAARILAVLEVRDRPEETIALVDRASSLDPGNPLDALWSGTAFYLLERMDEAAASLRVALPNFASDDDAFERLWALMYLCAAEADQDHDMAAWETCSEAVLLADRQGLPFLAGMSSTVLGTMGVRVSDLDLAKSAFRDAISFYEEADLPHGIASSRASQAMVHFLSEEYSAAATHIRAAIETLGAIGDDVKVKAAPLYLQLSFTEMAAGNGPAALKAAETAHAIARESGDPAMEAQAIGLLGRTEKALGNFEAARTFFSEGIALGERAGLAEKKMADFYGLLGTVHFSLQEYERAVARFLQAAEIYRALRDVEREQKQREAVAVVYYQLGDLDRAEPSLARSVALLERLAVSDGLAKQLALMGQISNARGDTTAACDYFSRAAHLFAESGRAEELEQTNAIIEDLHCAPPPDLPPPTASATPWRPTPELIDIPREEPKPPPQLPAIPPPSP